MAYNFNQFNNEIREAEEWLKREFQSLRTGRATPAILDAVSVESYGARMPVNQVASIAIEDAKTLRIAPWDATLIKPIEKAIRESDLGLSVSVDDKGLRVIFPALTTERRAQFAKVAKEKLEEARVRVRASREKVLGDIQRQEKEGSISEDERFRLKEQMQKLVDDANARLEEAAAKKETEIQTQ